MNNEKSFSYSNSNIVSLLEPQSLKRIVGYVNILFIFCIVCTLFTHVVSFPCLSVLFMSSIMKNLKANTCTDMPHAAPADLSIHFVICCRCMNQVPKPLLKVTVLLKLFTLRFSCSVLQLTYPHKWTAVELHWYVKWLHAVKEWMISVNSPSGRCIC